MIHRTTRQATVLFIPLALVLLCLFTYSFVQSREFARLGAQADDMIKNVAELNSVANEYIYYREERSFQQWEHKLVTVKANLKEWDDLDFYRNELDTMKLLLAEIESLFHEISRHRERTIITDEAASMLFLDLLNLQLFTNQLASANNDRAESYMNFFYAVSIVFITCSIAFILLSLRYITLGIVNPLTGFTRSLNETEQNRKSPGLPTELPNEIGILARAFADLQSRYMESAGENERLIEELKITNRDLEQFAYVASHDLKAPLRGIDNTSKWLLEDIGSLVPEESVKHLHFLRNRTERMEKLLTGLLEYSRIGRTEYRLADFTLRESLENALADIDVPEGVRLKFEVEDIPMRAEKIPLELVLRNLINNALKHGDNPRPEITLTGRMADGRFAEISVSDNGPGIPEEYHGKIFDIFTTLKPRDEVEGSGMGLALVQKSVINAGGEIGIESSPGSKPGTTFRFTWPVSPPHPAEEG